MNEIPKCKMKVKAVFLDAHTLNPGDIDFSNLTHLVDLKTYSRSSQDQIVERLEDVEILITNKCRISKEVIDQCPKLNFIQVAATGFDNIDVAYANSRNIVVCNVGAYSTQSVAQHVFAMLLSYLNRTETYNRQVVQGVWSASPDFSYWDSPIQELSGLTFGIIGFGKIGRAVSNIASAFGMNVIAYNRNPLDSESENVRFRDLNEVLENSDVLSLHASLNASSENLINSQTISRMKKNMILINTARGGLINEQDLFEGLENETIGAALLDVLSEEPPAADHILLNAKNCFITPHQAWASHGSRERLLKGIVQNIQAFLIGGNMSKVSG
jgi:glycerate dehydrogenase